MNSKHSVEDALLHRVYSEFLEMPGLRLTCRQAQRLWGLDELTCLRLLESLVDARFLCRLPHGMYARLSEGRLTHPRLRAIKARDEDEISRRRKKAV
jgi:hypothetical protein